MAAVVAAINACIHKGTAIEEDCSKNNNDISRPE
jgi:hypothetical protein